MSEEFEKELDDFQKLREEHDRIRLELNQKIVFASISNPSLPQDVADLIELLCLVADRTDTVNKILLDALVKKVYLIDQCRQTIIAREGFESTIVQRNTELSEQNRQLFELIEALEKLIKEFSKVDFFRYGPTE